jgi:hypothetical protein
MPVNGTHAIGFSIIRSGLSINLAPVAPENSGCKALCERHGGAMFKHCNAASAVFRGQAEGLETVFAHFCVARRSFSHAKPHSSRLELHKNGRQRGQD